MRPVTIDLDRVSVRFGAQTALHSFSGAFQPGTVTALIGGDGAGKSTLLKLLAGRLSASDGTTTGLPVERENIGYLAGESGVWRNLSVAENIEFVSRAYHLDPKESRAAELLTLAGLDHVTKRLAGRLSGGMRQKLGVILATMHRPGLVLLDEPTTGVDPISRAELWSLIAGAAADGATVVFATTYLDEAERANSLFLLGEGNLLASGTPDEVIAQTPGTIWEAPFTLAAARRELDSPTSWRRANTVYHWEASTHGPEGFTPAPGDLENTSIALLLREGIGDDTTAGLPVTGSAPPQRIDAPLVHAANISRTYGAFPALDGVSLHVEPGEIVGLLGGNGAGKTTLMRILLGLETPTAGEATLFGSPPTLDGRRRIGYVAQGLGLYPTLSAMENLDFAASVYGIPVSDEARAFAEGFGRSPVAALSLGTKRILAYLAASGHHPELLVLDEPTSGMDALTRARLWRNLRSSADNGTGVLVTTHYMQEAQQCDRLVMLSDGRVADITASHQSLTVTTDHWERAFRLLRGAGFAALLDGRVLRLPGAHPSEVSVALAPLNGAFTVTEGQATLEETMMLATRRTASAESPSPPRH